MSEARIRRSSWPDRVSYPLRLPASLHSELTAAAAKAAVTTTEWVSTVLEVTVLERADAAAIATYVESLPAEHQVHATLRLVPSLRKKVATRAWQARTSTNRYIMWAVDQALRA